jgi:hypothetical protein
MAFGQLLWPPSDGSKVDLLRAPTGPFITAVAMRTKLVCAGAFILSHYFHHLTRTSSLAIDLWAEISAGPNASMNRRRLIVLIGQDAGWAVLPAAAPQVGPA